MTGGSPPRLRLSFVIPESICPPAASAALARGQDEPRPAWLWPHYCAGGGRTRGQGAKPRAPRFVVDRCVWRPWAAISCRCRITAHSLPHLPPAGPASPGHVVCTVFLDADQRFYDAHKGACILGEASVACAVRTPKHASLLSPSQVACQGHGQQPVVFASWVEAAFRLWR